MFKDHNTPMKVLYIYGVEHSTKENSILIKPDIDLVIENGDVFAIMFFKNDEIENDDIIVKLESSQPLQAIFDTQESKLIGRCPLRLDGTLQLSDNCFAILRADLNLDSCGDTPVDVSVNVKWASLSQVGDDNVYPPVMEIKVKR